MIFLIIFVFRTIQALKPNDILDYFGFSDKKKIKTQILAIEKTLKRLNRKLAETQEFLNSPELYNDSSKMNLHDLLRDQVNLDAEIKSTEEEWLELNEELESS